MNDEGTMLFNMPFDAAKALRRRYGDEKYGPFWRDTSFLLQAYIEAVDIDNYLDIARDTKQLDLLSVGLIRERLAKLLESMRLAREANP